MNIAWWHRLSAPTGLRPEQELTQLSLIPQLDGHAGLALPGGLPALPPLRHRAVHAGRDPQPPTLPRVSAFVDVLQREPEGLPALILLALTDPPDKLFPLPYGD